MDSRNQSQKSSILEHRLFRLHGLSLQRNPKRKKTRYLTIYSKGRDLSLRIVILSCVGVFRNAELQPYCDGSPEFRFRTVLGEGEDGLGIREDSMLPEFPFRESRDPKYFLY
jgi:hypothetical protein